MFLSNQLMLICHSKQVGAKICQMIYISKYTRVSVTLSFQDVIKLETQYWTLVDIPKQEKQETVPAFVLRACSIMEKTHKSGEGVKTSARLAEEADTKRERIERLESELKFYYRRSIFQIWIVSLYKVFKYKVENQQIRDRIAKHTYVCFSRRYLF